MTHLTRDEHRALLDRYDRSGPRYTSYPTALHFHEGFGAGDYTARLMAADAVDAPWAVYIHLPFCKQRCLFCACNVIISPRKQAVIDYLDDLRREIDAVAAHIPTRRRISQLHLGGGTPTYFAPDELAGVLDHLLSVFELEPGAEASVEIDPRVTEDAHLRVLAERGFGRLSIGVQDLDPSVQDAVGRAQDTDRIRHLMALGRELGMDSVNLDLIYGLPGQTPATFERTLREVVDLGPDRLAVYGFAYVPWMKGHQKKLDKSALPDREVRFELLALAREVLGEAGYIDIGMDHFSRPDDELAQAQSEGRLWRNFMGYTVSKAPDMLGFGISAIGEVGGAFVQNARKLSTYRMAIGEGALPVERGYALVGDDGLRQAVIRELMCHGEVDKRAIERAFDIDFDTTFSDEIKALTGEVDAGMLTMGAEKIAATEQGKLFVRNIAMVFDRHLRQSQGAAPRYSRTV